MRIALFSSTIDPGDGYGNITKEYCTQLHANGTCFVLFLPRSQQMIVDAAGHPFAIRCELPEYIFRIFQPKALRYFVPTDVSMFDLVHSLFSFPYCVHALISASRYRKPFMMGAQGTHGVRPLTYIPERWLLKWCYRRAKAIVVPSVFTKEKIIEYAKCAYPITVIHNGVRFDRFQTKIDLTDLKNRYAGKKILLTVGGLWGRKGHDLVLRALPKVLRERSDVVYLIVGDGNRKQELMDIAKELNISHAVEFVGRKSGDDLVAYFQMCDIYVHTPRIVDLKFEGFGIVYLEASACGKPIVATDAGGVRDAVLDGETGLIAPDGDIDGVANHIIHLLNTPQYALSLGEAGKAYAQANDWHCIVKAFQNLYTKISLNT